ncbi:hypothetical protein WJX74_003590 [Apatococcus lobatus]|uniref:Uncharacterized protein n=1 Tax=Apatococcus lobatus TaxID=904363 RepID=A0AAW1Q543_9CHLO
MDGSYIKQLAPNFQAGLQLNAANDRHGCHPVASCDPVDSLRHPYAWPLSISEDRSPSRKPRDWHEVHDMMLGAGEIPGAGEELGASSRLSSLHSERTRPWRRLPFHSPACSFQTEAPPACQGHGLQVATPSPSGLGVPVSTAGQPMPTSSFLPQCFLGIPNGADCEMALPNAQFAGPLDGRHEAQPTLTSIGEDIAHDNKLRDLPQLPISSPKHAANLCPLGSSMHAGDTCDANRVPDNPLPAEASPAVRLRHRRPRRQQHAQNPCNYLKALPAAAGHAFDAPREGPPTLRTEGLLAKPTSHSDTHDLPEQAGLMSLAAYAHGPTGNGLNAQHAHGRSQVTGTNAEGRADRASMRQHALQLPLRPQPESFVDEGKDIPITDAEGHPGQVDPSLLQQLQVTGRLMTENRRLSDANAVFCQLQRQAALALFQSANQLAHTNLDEADFPQNEHVASGGTPCLQVSGEAYAAQQHPSDPATCPAQVNSLLQLPEHGGNEQQCSRGNSSHHLHGPALSVHDVTDGLRHKGLHVNIGFAALHEAQDAKPAPAIDRAKRMIEERCAVQYRSVRARPE